MGTLFSVTLPAYRGLQQRQAWQRTDENIRRVEEALTLHFMQRGSLPYPVDIAGQPLKDETVGYLPYRALNLSEHTTRDGQHRPIRYAAHKELACNNIRPSPPHYRYFRELHGAPHVKDDQEKSVIRDDSDLAWVLVVGTENDHPDERKNLDNTMDFIDRPFSTHPESLFRHRVWYCTIVSLYTQAFSSKDLDSGFFLLNSDLAAQRVAQGLPDARIPRTPAGTPDNPEHTRPRGRVM